MPTLGKLVLMAMLAATTAAAADAATISFDDLASDGYFQFAPNPYQAQGWRFANDAAPADFALFAWGRGSFGAVYNADANPATGATLAHNYNNSITTVSRIDGAAFTLGSLSMADVYNTGSANGPVIFTFLTLAGTTSETRFFDTVRGLQTEVFDRAGLLSFTIAPRQFDPPMSFSVAGLIQIDNVGVSLDAVMTPGGVPEPSSWALLIDGFGLNGAAMRRRRAITAL